jgi:hypothetical protein
MNVLNIGRAVLLAAVLLFGLGSVAVWAVEIRAAPNGKPDGDGSAARPYDLLTVLAGKANVQPGDVVLLQGGQYDGAITKTDKGLPRRIPFEPNLRGTAEKPIVVTSAPGQWAHLNGSLNTQQEKCAFVHFVRLEIGDLDWDPLQQKHLAETAVNSFGGEGLKLVNCNVFGGAMGLGLWRPAVNFEAYGNLIHDFGWHAANLRGSGHAAYIQNDQGTKRLEHNIAYRGCGWNFDIYTEQGEIKGFDIIENIGYIASWHKPGQVGFNFGLTGRKPAERIRFIGNVGYHSRDSEQPWRSNMRLIYSWKKDTVHRDAIVKDNYMMGTCRALVLGPWQHVEVTGNTFWAKDVVMEISSAPAGSGVAENLPKPGLSNYRVDGNTYYNNGQAKPFIYGAHESALEDEEYSFAQWQAMGLDKNSRMLPGRGGRPTGTKVFVFPNKYDRGRANVAIFNWDGLERVDVDLSQVLQRGQKYRIYNCLDLKRTLARAKPVASGTYAGSKLRFPMLKDKSSPDFDAFLVLPE